MVQICRKEFILLLLSYRSHTLFKLWRSCIESEIYKVVIFVNNRYRLTIQLYMRCYSITCIETYQFRFCRIKCNVVFLGKFFTSCDHTKQYPEKYLSERVAIFAKRFFIALVNSETTLLSAPMNDLCPSWHYINVLPILIIHEIKVINATRHISFCIGLNTTFSMYTMYTMQMCYELSAS